MIELQLIIDCEGCGEELHLSEDDLVEVANFGTAMIRCWGLEELPDGWVEEYDEMYCPTCKENGEDP